MKLYEFEYFDNQNLDEQQLKKRVEKFLETECFEKGWGKGYSYKESCPPQKQDDGGTKYSFEVHGEYLGSSSVSFDDEKEEAMPLSDSLVASPLQNDPPQI